MKIYVSHASSFDYKTELYEPLRNSKLNDLHEIILPHEESKEPINSKEIIPTCDLMIAEVSHPSTGQGMEMAWADFNKIPIMAIYKKGVKISTSIKVLAQEMIEYKNEDDMIHKISTVLRRLKNN